MGIRWSRPSTQPPDLTMGGFGAGLRDIGAPLRQGLEDAVALEPAEGATDDLARELELSLEAPFRGKAISALDLPGKDQGRDLLDDGVLGIGQEDLAEETERVVGIHEPLSIGRLWQSSWPSAIVGL